jgi:DNA-binding NarL/FixJ family response regulator
VLRSSHNERCASQQLLGEGPVDESDIESRSELTVVLADDHVPTRAGIERALTPHGIRVVAAVGNADDALRAALRHRPDVCVLAIRMPGNGIEAARMINEALPATKIVMLTVSDRDDDLFAALRAGADGYLLMSTSAVRLPHAIRGVMSGEAALPREMTARLIREFRERPRRNRLPLSLAAQGIELTPREFEVLEWLRKQENTANIAAELGISEITVRRHISAILHKLGAPNRRGAVELLERAEQLELKSEAASA